MFYDDDDEDDYLYYGRSWYGDHNNNLNDSYYKDRPQITTQSLERALRLILEENSFDSNFMEKIIFRHMGQRWEQRSLLLSQISSWRK